MAIGQPRVEIVTHCWAGRHRHYAQSLCYQLSSLFLDTPQRCHVTIRVCYVPDDVLTMEMIHWFIQNNRSRNICITGICGPIEKIGRRAIGRNIAAKQTIADLVWFTDCDHVFLDGCLDRLAGMDWPDGASMIYPTPIQIHRDHATGDMTTALVDRPKLISVNKAEFIPKHYNRAIGGVQIVQGDFARKHGYLDGDEKWQRPLNRKTFVSCRCDRAYRTRCLEHGSIVPVDLPGVYRIRHTATTHHEK